MAIIGGSILVLLSLLCWGGQTLSWLAPETAVRRGLRESDDDVEPVYAADIEGEAVWDAFTLWTLLVAGVLLIFDSTAWPYFGLIGGAMYVYFAGRGILTRRVMIERSHRVGSESNVTAAFVMLGVWGVAGLATIIAAVIELGGR